jgi:hypothetical protein
MYIDGDMYFYKHQIQEARQISNFDELFSQKQH